MNTKTVSGRRILLYSALLFILSMGCSRTAPLGNRTDTSDSGWILPSSSDIDIVDTIVPQGDTQTDTVTASMGDTESDSGPDTDVGDTIDTAVPCPYECTYTQWICENGAAAGLAADGIVMTDLQCSDVMMAEGKTICCNNGVWFYEDTADTATSMDTDTPTDSADSASAWDSDTLHEDTATAWDSDSLPPECDCNEHQWCEKSTGSCWCVNGYKGPECRDCDTANGYVPWPGRDGICIPNSCSDIVCDGEADCRIDLDGRPSCACASDLTGSHCRQQWQTLLVPPFASDVAFDNDGNGWFATSQGMLYWHFNNTPKDLSDDTMQWYASRNYTAVNSIAIDSYGRKWIGGMDRLIVLNDNGTPFNRKDDTEITVDANLGTFSTVAKVVVDANDRCWLVATGNSGVYVLENIGTAMPLDTPHGTETAPQWQQIYTEYTVTDMAVDGNGLWLGGEALLTYIDMGSDIGDTSDDVALSLSSIAQFDRITHIELDAGGLLWVTTTDAIFTAQNGEFPPTPAGYRISEWTPQPDSAVSKTGPVVANGKDGAKWLQSTWGALVRIDDSNAEMPGPTAYAPLFATGWADISQPRNVTAIAIDDAERKWLIYEGMLHVLDDQGTPMTPEDDIWTRVEKWSLPVDTLSEVVPDAHGGAWVHGTHNAAGVPGCADELFYVSPGHFADGFDDVAVSYRHHVFSAETPFCGEIHGIDARGLIWLTNSADRNDTVKSLVLDDNQTPLYPDDDIMAEYVEGDESVFVHAFLGFDRTEGVWVNSGHLSLGRSLSDRTDDMFVPIAPPGVSSDALMSVAVDTAGYRWFGYNIERTPDGQWASNGLQCLNDGGTLADTDDDTWTGFYANDGMPFAAMTEAQPGGSDMIWIRKNIDQRKTPQFCGLDHNGTPMDKRDDSWIVVYLGYQLYRENAALRTILDFKASSTADVWFGTSHGVQYLHLNN
ncbi:MAG: hypothetical protein JXX14_21500 [Deltaproteobacteria bacterium]|nr:hypothetical protein [Deltaproteobacteria bacterium]